MPPKWFLTKLMFFAKLVPQDPSDEPAETLLGRIRAEKQRLIKEGKIKKDKHESVIFRRDNSHYEKPLSAATVKPNRFSLIASPFRRDRRSALSAALVLQPDKNGIHRRDGNKRNRTASKAGRPDNCEALSGNSHRQAYPGLTRPNALADRPAEYCGIHSSAHADIRLPYGRPAASHCHRKASPQPYSNETAAPSRAPNPRS